MKCRRKHYRHRDTSHGSIRLSSDRFVGARRVRQLGEANMLPRDGREISLLACFARTDPRMNIAFPGNLPSVRLQTLMDIVVSFRPLPS